MKKQVFLRSLLGAFVGCFIGVVIIICISLAIGGGDMHVATPALLAQVGSEVGAFSLQMAAAMLIGAIWSGASVIWEVEREPAPADADALSPVQRRLPADCVGNGLDGRSARLVSLRLRRDVRRHLAD